MGNQLPDAYGASPTTIVMEITSGTGFPISIHVENRNSLTAPTTPCGGAPGPCTTPVVLALLDTFTVHPASGEIDLTNETHFYLGTTSASPEFVFTNKNNISLHTSCSAPLIGQTGTIGGYTLTVLSQQGGSGNSCDVVGGHGGPIDKTSLLVTGAQLNASWMIPLLISAIGIGLFVVTRKS